jgi:hypothetical protein
MSLRSELSGRFSLDQLDRLTFPIAWSGTKDTTEAQQEEADLHELVREAQEQLQAAYDMSDIDDVEYEIEIKDGEIVEIH